MEGESGRVEGGGGEWRGRVEEREVTHVRREEGGEGGVKAVHLYYIIQIFVFISKFPYMGKSSLTFCSGIVLMKQPWCVVFSLQY